MFPRSPFSFFFFFNDTATTEIYTLSLHDALPIYAGCGCNTWSRGFHVVFDLLHFEHDMETARRSEEHTSELQSHLNLVCRLLLEKKKQNCSEKACLSSMSVSFCRSC